MLELRVFCTGYCPDQTINADTNLSDTNRILRSGVRDGITYYR